MTLEFRLFALANEACNKGSTTRLTCRFSRVHQHSFHPKKSTSLTFIDPIPHAFLLPISILRGALHNPLKMEWCAPPTDMRSSWKRHARTKFPSILASVPDRRVHAQQRRIGWEISLAIERRRQGRRKMIWSIGVRRRKTIGYIRTQAEVDGW